MLLITKQRRTERKQELIYLATKLIMIYPHRYYITSNQSKLADQAEIVSKQPHHHPTINKLDKSAYITTNHSIATAKNDLSQTTATIESSNYWIRHRNKFKRIPSSVQSAHKLLFLITLIIYTLFSDFLICTTHCADVSSLIRVSDDDKSSNQKFSDLGITSDPLQRNGNDGVSPSSGGRGTGSGLYLEKIGSLEMSIAAVFNKVAYGTTTKRSIADTNFVPNLTTVPTPQLTTYR